MSDPLSIYQSIARLMFPKGLLDYFTVVNVVEKDIPISEQQGVETGEITFHLDEMEQLRHPEEGHAYRPNGFYEPSKVRDFPLRDKKSDAGGETSQMDRRNDREKRREHLRPGCEWDTALG